MRIVELLLSLMQHIFFGWVLVVVLMWDLVLLGLLGCGRVVIHDVLRTLLLMQGLFLLLLVLEFPIMFLR
jgi:hypothetical protein